MIWAGQWWRITWRTEKLKIQERWQQVQLRSMGNMSTVIQSHKLSVQHQPQRCSCQLGCRTWQYWCHSSLFGHCQSFKKSINNLERLFSIVPRVIQGQENRSYYSVRLMKLKLLIYQRQFEEVTWSPSAITLFYLGSAVWRQLALLFRRKGNDVLYWLETDFRLEIKCKYSTGRMITHGDNLLSYLACSPSHKVFKCMQSIFLSQ